MAKRLRGIPQIVPHYPPGEDKGPHGPWLWYGNDELNASDGPWYDAPPGSLYLKVGETTGGVYTKVLDTGASTDWEQLRGPSAILLNSQGLKLQMAGEYEFGSIVWYDDAGEVVSTIIYKGLDLDYGLFFQHATPGQTFEFNGPLYVTSGSINCTHGAAINKGGTDSDTTIYGSGDGETSSTPTFKLDASTHQIGIGKSSPAAKLHIDQFNTTGAMPVLTLDQADVSEEFIRFIGTSTTDASQSIVDAADMEDPGAIVGWLKIYVKDDQATNGITDGYYYVPFYAAPTHSG